MDRRRFLQHCGAGCAWALALPLVVGAEGCASLTMVHAVCDPEGTVRIPRSLLPLQGNAIVRVKTLRDDLYLVREAGDGWHALLMRCTHQDQPLVVAGNGLACNSHGSRFDPEGNVTHPPAMERLQRYEVIQAEEGIRIELRRLDPRAR